MQNGADVDGEFPNLGHGDGVGSVAGVAQERFRDDAGVEAELVTVKQVAQMLSVCGRTIYRLVASGELPAPVKVGSASRFPVAEIHAYVERLKRDRRDCSFGRK